MLEARFLGKFEILVDGAPIDIPARKAQSLFAYLIMSATNHHRREKLAGMLWPEYDEASARSKLRYALWQLRNAVGDQYFSADKITLAINQESDYWVDCAELEKKLVEPISTAQIESLASLYMGELLPGFYEDWIFLERDQLRAAYDQKVSVLIERLSKEDCWREVLEWAERWISFGQIPEPAYQALMIAYSHLGDKAGATSTYLRLEQTLNEELGVEPSEITRQLYEHILQDELKVVSLDYPTSPVLKSKQLSPAYPGIAEIKPDPEIGAFVAKEKELAWLDDKLRVALEGDGQVAFVVGDAGQGKTAILRQFSQQAQNAQEDLVIAYATCEAFSGMGDPYLPFRNILALLTGDVAAKQSTGVINQENAQRLWDMIPYSSQALLEYGPDLVDSFVSGESLVRRSSSYTLDRPDWLENIELEVNLRKGRPFPVNIDHGDLEKNLFDQYSRVLQTLSQTNPLLIILDDLQWADPGSLSLLFHLARRIEKHPILIFGSYRPVDIAQLRETSTHPLVEMLPEFRRIFGEIEVNLNQADHEDRRKFVDDYLNTEPNNFNEEFRQALYLHTAGHPLFTIELLRQMQNQSSIVKDYQGNWIEAEELSWETMPARVEAVIEQRVIRLSPELRDILNAASVEGEEFTAEVIAAATEFDSPEIIRRLSQDLAKNHKLVEISEIKRVGQQRLSIYRFRHNLFRKYVYDDLDLAEKTYLHENVGAALEQLYGDKKGLVAVQLAGHYEMSGEIDKAIDYLLMAGKNARRVSANEQAIILMSKGIDLLNQLPEGQNLAETELALQISLGPPLVATQGYASEQVERTFERARELCEQTGDVQQLAPALWGLCGFYQVRGKHKTAFQMANQIKRLADSSEDPNLRLLAHWMLGLTHTHLGEFSAAKDHLETALKLYDYDKGGSLTFLYGQNPRVTCLNYLAINLWILGYLDQGVQKCQEAVDYAEQLSHPYSLTFAHGTAALFHSVRRNPQSALHHSELAFKLAKESGFPFFLALSMIIRGWARSLSGKGGMARKLVENGVEAMQAIGTELGRPFYLSLLAEVKGIDSKEGVELVRSALDKAEASQELWFISSIYWLWGNIGESHTQANDEIITRYWQAIEIAAEQEAKSFELRGAVALVKFNKTGEKAQLARELLRETYQWFDADLDDELLVEAKAVIK